MHAASGGIHRLRGRPNVCDPASSQAAPGSPQVHSGSARPTMERCFPQRAPCGGRGGNKTSRTLHWQRAAFRFGFPDCSHCPLCGGPIFVPSPVCPIFLPPFLEAARTARCVVAICHHRGPKPVIIAARSRSSMPPRRHIAPSSYLSVLIKASGSSLSFECPRPSQCPLVHRHFAGTRRSHWHPGAQAWAQLSLVSARRCCWMHF